MKKKETKNPNRKPFKRAFLIVLEKYPIVTPATVQIIRLYTEPARIYFAKSPNTIPATME